MKALLVIIGIFLSVLPAETTFAGEITENNSIKAAGEKRAIALKSNLLYWAAATPNVSAEFYLSSRLSLNTDVDFAWWSDKSASFYWQVFGVTPELRYWFSDKRTFKGHYAGVYMNGGLYDIMLKPLTGKKGYQGTFYGAGVSYGYVFPIDRHFSLELGLGLGYMATTYDEYVKGCSDFMRTDSKRTRWIGPTKINVTLVWQIPR